MPAARTTLEAPALEPAEPELPTTSRRWLVLVIVCLAQFMVILDATIVNVALPSIQRGLHFSQESLQWVVNAYALFFGGFLLLGGRAADLLGRRRMFLAGVLVFSLASLLNGLAHSSGVLIAGRALQGLGGAMLSPAALSSITTTFTDTTERTRALGVWSGIAAGGGAIGLLLGGVLTSALSWEWIFFVNVPVGIVAFLAAIRFVPESRAETAQRTFDVAGAASVTAGLVVLVFALVKAQAWGWGSASTLGLFATSAALLVTFAVIERRSSFPLMRLSVFRIRSLATGDLVLLFAAAGLFAMFFFSSLYAQEVLGYSPLKAGLAFLPLAAGIMGGAASAQRLIRRFGVRAVGGTGLSIATIGMVLLARMPVGGAYASDLLPGLLALALGMGLAFVPITLLATSGVGEEDAGLASGLFNTMQQIGGSLGLAVLSTLAASRTDNVLKGAAHATSATEHSALVDGFHVAYAAGAVLLGIGAVLIVALLRRRHVESVQLDPADPISASHAEPARAAS